MSKQRFLSPKIKENVGKKFRKNPSFFQTKSEKSQKKLWKKFRKKNKNCGRKIPKLKIRKFCDVKNILN